MSQMISAPENYFKTMLPESNALLQAMERAAEQEEIPIIGPLIGQLYESPDWAVVNLYAFLPRHSPEKDGLCLATKL